MNVRKLRLEEVGGCFWTCGSSSLGIGHVFVLEFLAVDSGKNSFELEEVWCQNESNECSGGISPPEWTVAGALRASQLSSTPEICSKAEVGREPRRPGGG
jgi:hypothetical protein